MTTPFTVVTPKAHSNDGFRVVDVETTMNSNLPNKASPFDSVNRMVMFGKEEIDTPFDVLVGHNITFDINWLRKTKTPDCISILHRDLLKRKTIWDTQLAAYLLSGQQDTMTSLDHLAVKYGGTVKDSFVSDFFKKGLGADHVPQDKLSDYLLSDLANTRLVLEAQLKEAHEKNMVPLILSQMEGLLATAEMQWNGMHVDKKYLDHQLLVLDTLSAGHDKIIKDLSRLYSPTEHTFDFTSNKQLSALLYGGTLKYENRVANGVYKTGAKMGQPKYKLEKGVHNFLPLITSIPATSQTVDDDTLKQCIPLLTADVARLVATILDKRKIDKQRITYFEGHGACIASDGRVHPQHNHTVTRTGRLSSSGPNMQNVTSDGLIKKCYVSRWGDEGVLVEADYQQLEIVVLAHLSNDLVLKNDLLTGKDMHSELYKSMYGRHPTKEERKPFKRLSFALVYGGGVNAMMENAKVDKETATKFRKVFYERYQGVKKWHDKLKGNAIANVVYEGRKTTKGYPSHTYRMTTETGRLYEFHEYDNDWTGNPSFSPTELVNYPVQGTATGDIVPMVLGKLFRRLINSELYDKCLMINTVHDSVLFDVHKDVLDQAIKMIKETMEAAPTYYKETFGVDFSLSLPVGISVGPNWLDMKEYV
jgi:DNA polymerase I